MESCCKELQVECEIPFSWQDTNWVISIGGTGVPACFSIDTQQNNGITVTKLGCLIARGCQYE
jgi:hypothetical protein